METTQKNSRLQPYLPKGQTILYVAMSHRFMARAREVAHGSNEKQQSTGAVIVCDNKIVSEASNMNPLTMAWMINLHKNFCIRHLFHIPSGKKYWVCPGCAGKESHAESRAVKQLIKSGIPEGNLDLYLWGHWWCCDVCWKNMLKLPVKHVYLLDNSDMLFYPKSLQSIIGKQFD